MNQLKLEKHLLYSVLVMSCNCKLMLRSRELNWKKYKQAEKKLFFIFSLLQSQ